MPLYVFQSSANPLVRFLIGLATLAVLAGLAFLMLPVVLFIVGAVLVLGLAAWGWAWYQNKKNGDPTEQLRRAMERAQAEARQRYGADEGRQRQPSYGPGPDRIETSDSRQWKMNDVEDIEEQK